MRPFQNRMCRRRGRPSRPWRSSSHKQHRLLQASVVVFSDTHSCCRVVSGAAKQVADLGLGTPGHLISLVWSSAPDPVILVNNLA